MEQLEHKSIPKFYFFFKVQFYLKIKLIMKLYERCSSTCKKCRRSVSLNIHSLNIFKLQFLKHFLNYSYEPMISLVSHECQ